MQPQNILFVSCTKKQKRIGQQIDPSGGVDVCVEVVDKQLLNLYISYELLSLIKHHKRHQRLLLVSFDLLVPIVLECCLSLRCYLVSSLR